MYPSTKPKDVTNYSKSITPLQSLSNSSYIVPISSSYSTLKSQKITFLKRGKDKVETYNCKKATTNSSN
jgi:hypothetical protein